MHIRTYTQVYQTDFPKLWQNLCYASFNLGIGSAYEGTSIIFLGNFELILLSIQSNQSSKSYKMISNMKLLELNVQNKNEELFWNKGKI